LSGELTHVFPGLSDSRPVCVFSESVSEHGVHLAEVVLRLIKANLRLRPEKCSFYRQCVDYLGHVVSVAGIRTAPSKVADLRDVPAPSTGKQMQAIVNYLRHFIPCLATMAAPLDELRNSRSIDARRPCGLDTGMHRCLPEHKGRCRQRTNPLQT
jgi:hypothetical protein